MATVRAKFKVVRIERTMNLRSHRDEVGRWVVDPPAEVQTVVLAPVYSEDPNSENRRFWEATPSGEIKLGVINQAAWSAFELDREYYVDFSPAD